MEILINVKVKPKSKREYIKKISENNFEIAVKEPPEKGKANKRALELISKYFKVAKSDVSIVKGKSSRIKLVKINKI